MRERFAANFEQFARRLGFTTAPKHVGRDHQLKAVMRFPGDGVEEQARVDLLKRAVCDDVAKDESP